MLPDRLPPFKRLKWLREWLNQLWDHCLEITPQPSRNVRVNRTTRGTSYIGVPQEEGVADTSDWFLGEYDPTRSYPPQKCVVIRGGGPSSGAYVSVRDVPINTPPGYPDVGIYWVALRAPEVIYWT